VEIEQGTELRGEQSFEAGVPASHRRARRGRAEGRGRRVKARTTGLLAAARNRRHGPVVRRAFTGKPRQGVGAAGKAVVNRSRTSRRPWPNANPHGSKGPRERVRLPGSAKALKGDSRDASGMEQGREASGRHGGRRAPRGVRTFRGAARTVERGKNPEDGTGEELALLALRGRVLARSRRTGHPALWRSREQETQERRIPRSRKVRGRFGDHETGRCAGG